VERLYRLALGRPPSAREREMALRFVGEGQRLAQWEQLVQTVFACVDFRYVN
jgi:hypothetical protein